MSFKSSTLNYTLAAATLAAMALATSPAWAQGGGMTGPGPGSTGMMGATGNSKTGLTAAPGTPMSSNSMAKDSSKLASSDSKMLKDLAQGNMAEVEAGKLALEKSPSDATKKFAQMMVDDHSAALGEVQKLAGDKGVTLPDGPSIMQKAKATAMKALSGNTFDKEYRKHAGVGDHEATVKLLKKIQSSGKDADLKALATKMLPTVQHHLAEAKTLAAQKS